MKRFLMTLALVAAALSVHAAEESYGSEATRYYGSASADDALLFTSGDLVRFGKGCTLMSTDGAVDVEASLDGTNFSSAVSLQDLGATTVDPVLVTAADRMYYVPGFYRFLRVRQNGMTASAASLYCKR